MKATLLKGWAKFKINIKKVDIGSYPFFRLGKIGVSIVSRSRSKIILREVKKDLIQMANIKKIKKLVI